MPEKNRKNIRYNIVNLVVYAMALVLVLGLFNLQILNGEEYYARSSRRLTREVVIEAARGDILDRNGNMIVGTVPRYSVVIYRSRIGNDTLNETILNVINILRV